MFLVCTDTLLEHEMGHSFFFFFMHQLKLLEGGLSNILIRVELRITKMTSIVLHFVSGHPLLQNQGFQLV